MMNDTATSSPLPRILSMATGIAVGVCVTVWVLASGKQAWSLSAFGLAWAAFEFLFPSAPKALSSLIRWSAIGCIGALAASGLVSTAQGFWETPWTFNASILISARETLKIWLLYHGQSIYPPPGEYPFLVTLYTPVFFVLGAALNTILHNPVLSGMILSAIPFIILIFLTLLWIRQEGGSWPVAFFATMAMATSSEIFMAGAIIRPDWLAWLFAYSGAYLFMANRGSTRSLTLGCLLLAAAALTKQQTAPILLGLATVWIIDRSLLRRSGRMILVTGLTILAGALAAQGLSGGGFFIDTLLYPTALAGNPDITNWSSAVPRIRHFAILNAPVLVVWALGLLYCLIKRKIHWLDWLLLVQIPFLIRLLMTWGAADNYYWGFMIALYARAGLIISQIIATNRKFFSLASLVFLIAIFTRPIPLPHSYFDTSKEEEAILQNKAIISQYNNGKDPILINSELSGYILTNAYAPNLFFFDSIELLFFERAKFWKLSGSTLEKDIIERKFSTIVLGSTFINTSFKSLVESFYDTVHDAGIFRIYSPRPGDAILFPFPTDQPIAKGPLTLQVTQVHGVEANSGFGGFSFSRKDGSKESYVEFTLTKSARTDLISVLFHPKVASMAPGNSVDVEWSPEGEAFRPLFAAHGTPNDMSNEISAHPNSFSVASAARSIRFRFHLRGNGQIWYSQEIPILFRAAESPQ